MTDDNDKSNVASIQDAALKKQKKAGKNSTGTNPPSLTVSQKQAFIASWLNNEITPWMLEQGITWTHKPSERFMLLRMRANLKSLYRVTPENEVVPCMEDDLISVIAKAAHTDFYDFLEPTDKIIKGSAAYWQMVTPLSIPPKVFAWGDTDDLALRRLPCVYGRGPTPYWDSLVGNFTNSQAIEAFIGSLLEDESYMQQYIWIYGAGGDGKGTLINFLSKLLGTLHKAETVPQPTNRFWLYGFKDARLVTFAECEDSKFINSALFKSASGGDVQRLENKFGMPFSGSLMAKFIFCSNEKPNITSETSKLRRIIYCESNNLVKMENIDTNFNKKLWDERGYIISKCLDIYRQLCPTHGPIPDDRSGVLDLAETNEDIFEAFLEDQFNVGPNERCPSTILAQRIANRFKTYKEEQAFRRWLKDKKGILRKSERAGSNVLKKYYGISPKFLV